MIPKLFHHVWASDTPFAEKFVQYRKSYLDLHPDYSFRFWRRENASEYALSNDSLKLQRKDSGLHWIVISDIMKHEILYRFGGILIGTDNFALKPYDPLLKYGSFAGASYGGEPVGNCVYGTEPRNPIFKECAEAIVNNILEKGVYAANAEPWKVSGPMFTSKYMLKLGVILPVETFYPFSHKSIPDLPRTDSAILVKHFPNSFSVHWWEGVNGWAKEKRT